MVALARELLGLAAMKTIALVAAASLAGGLSLAGCHHDRPGAREPPSPIAAVYAVDADSAVLIREPEVDRGGWIEAVDRRGWVRWMQPLPGVPLVHGPYRGLMVAGDTVTVRYAHVQGGRAIDQAVVAYALRDGSQRWDVVLTPFRAGSDRAAPGLEDGASSLAVGALFAFWASDGTRVHLYGIAGATGKVVSDQDVSGQRTGGVGGVAPMTDGARVVEHDLDAIWVDDPSGAAPARRVPTDGAGCLVGTALITVAREEGAARIDSVDLATGAPQTIGRLAVGDPTSSPMVMRCARDGDRLVFSATASIDHGDHQVIVVITRSGETLHVVDLGPARTIPDGYDQYPDTAPFAGELPRFALVALHGTGDHGEPHAPALTMVDLEAGRIAWTAREDQQLSTASLVHQDGRWYLSWPQDGVLAVFDGATGRLSAAVRFDDVPIAGVLPFEVAGGLLWLTVGDQSSAGPGRFVVLDAATLAPVRAPGIHLTDVTAELRAKLGIP